MGNIFLAPEMCEPDIPFFIICTTDCGFRFRCTASQVLLDGFAFSMIPRMRLCTAAHLRWGRRRRRSIPPQAACGRVWRETFSLSRDEHLTVRATVAEFCSR